MRKGRVIAGIILAGLGLLLTASTIQTVTQAQSTPMECPPNAECWNLTGFYLILSSGIIAVLLAAGGVLLFLGFRQHSQPLNA